MSFRGLCEGKGDGVMGGLGGVGTGGVGSNWLWQLANGKAHQQGLPGLESVMEADSTMPSPDLKPAHRAASVLQRTVTTLHRVTSVSLLEALDDDVEFGQPETLESQLGRTLKDLLCTP